ncbi:MAG: hypothetical protein CR994_06640 [Maribacter sp.]|nr:MAG: hypothetical protein CR994_06640 [Maribacter sp.]
MGGNNGTVSYIYDATGARPRKNVLENGVGTFTDYAGNYIYENGTLQFFNHPEGYVEPDGSGGYDYVYQYRDVWGNVRLSYADINSDGSVDQAEILQERNYYPFGLQHKGYNGNIQGVENNHFTYQGQELTEDLGLNVHEWRYRMSDPAIGRFWQVDPLAEDFMYNSTYAFQENKLGIGVELEGLEVSRHEWLDENGQNNIRYDAQIKFSIIPAHQLTK